MNKFIPNSFQLPNAVIDDFLAKMSGNAFKCYALIARQTTGWQKQSDKISVSQFMVKCGIKDRKTAMKCLEELEEISLILTFKKCGEITEFSLNLNPEMPEFEPVPKNGTSTSTKNWDTTKNTIKNKNKTLTGFTKKSQSAVEILAEFGITGQLAEDFISVRKAKKAPITQTAINRIAKQAEIAGLSLVEAFELMIERNWTGFSASWDWQGVRSNTAQANKPKLTGKTDPDWWKGKTIETWKVKGVNY